MTDGCYSICVQNGITALMTAVRNCRLEVVEKLVELGANLAATDDVSDSCKYIFHNISRFEQCCEATIVCRFNSYSCYEKMTGRFCVSSQTFQFCPIPIQ